MRVDADTIHIAPRETYIKNVLDILGLGDNQCKAMPPRIVQTRQKSDEGEPRLGEEDRVNDAARIHERSELPGVVKRRERMLRRGDDDSRGTAPATTPGILGSTGQAAVADRLNGSTRHDPAVKVRSSQAQ